MLNIKDPDAHRMAQELAAARGTTMTGAVTEALRSALAEQHHQQDVKRHVLLGLIASARANGNNHASDPFLDLYHPTTGLPQ